MMRRRCCLELRRAHQDRRILAKIAVSMMLLLSLSILDMRFADAQEEKSPLRTYLDVQLPASTVVGERVTVLVQMSSDLDPEPGALGNEAIELFVDGQYERRVRTDENGLATFRLRREWSAGTYQVTAQYGGTMDLAGSSDAALLTVSPARVMIQTVPPQSGLQFELGDEIAGSNAAGLVKFLVSEAGTYRLEFIGSVDPDARIFLDRWGDPEFAPDRYVEVDGHVHLEAGFEIHYPVKIDFVDLEGEPVPADQITAVSMTSNHGQRITLTDELDVWLQASRVTRRRNGLELVPALWSIESVEINGTSVVNRNQQRFDLVSADSWTLELLLYSARITARDAFFRFPIGTGVELHYPDGTKKVFPFNSDNEVLLFSMPRGNYHIRVVGASGLAPLAPIALTRDQEAELLVLSYLDMGFAGTVALAVVLGLLFVGRPEIPRYAWRQIVRISPRRRPRRVAPAASSANAHLMTTVPDDVNDADRTVRPERFTPNETDKSSCYAWLERPRRTSVASRDVPKSLSTSVDQSRQQFRTEQLSRFETNKSSRCAWLKRLRGTPTAFDENRSDS